jgi:hypothetical protein
MLVESVSIHEFRNSTACGSVDIAVYLDGELPPDAEIAFELHIAQCADCRGELNLQKNLLRELDVCLGTGEIKLPKNFAKTVIVNAESNVSGLRRPNERFNAIFISAGLFLFALFTLGAGGGKSFAAVNSLTDKIFAVAGSVGHFVYDISLGTVIIFRSLGATLFSGSFVSILFIGAVAVLSLVFLSRLLLRPHRA